MTENARARHLLRTFAAMAASNFTLEGVEAFQRQVHARFHQEFGFHFLLLMMITMEEGGTAQEESDFPILRQALERQLAHMPHRTGEYLGHLRSLGMQFIQDRQLHLAAPLLEQVLTTSRGQVARNASELVWDLLNLAMLYRELERHEESIALHHEALALLAAEEQATSTHANAWHELAKIYGALGRLLQAEETYLRSLVLYQDLPTADANDVADVLNDLGTIYRSLGQADVAAARFREALDLRRSAAAPNYAGIVHTLNNLGNLEFDQGKLEEAEALYREALPLATRYSTPADQGLALTRNNIAQVGARRNNPEEAIRLMEEAVRDRRAMHPPHHSEVISTLRNLAGAYARAGRLDHAIETASEALGIELSNEQFPISSKRLSAWARPAEKTFGLLLHLMNLQAERHLRYDWPAQASLLLTYKGNAEIEQGLASILQAAATGELKDLLERRKELQVKVAQTRSARVQMPGGVVARQLEDLQILEGALEKHPEARRLADELQLRTVKPESVRSALRPDEALLNYFVTGEDIFAQVLHQDGEHHFTRLEGREAVELVESVQRRLRSAGAGPLYLSDPELQDLLRRAYDRLIAPLDNLLRLSSSLQSLVISADSFLYGLPWELLTAERDAESVTLLERVSVRLIPTPRDLVRLHRLEELHPGTLESALLLGVQQFGSGPVGEGTEERGPDSLFPTRAGLGLAGGTHLPPYRDLAGTRSEVEQLATTFQGHQVQVVALLSPHATEQHLLNLDSAPSVLHLATHSDVWTPEAAQAHYSAVAQVDDARLDPFHPFSRAVVVLDGYDRTSFRGVLRAWELASLHLMGTQLVTFSSCDSGLGDMSAGRSVAGLSQAAFLSGALRTITTLWPVSDRDAPQWMTDVYRRRLEGAAWQEAVRASKLAMLEDEYPLNAWAPFVLNGLA